MTVRLFLMLLVAAATIVAVLIAAVRDRRGRAVIAVLEYGGGLREGAGVAYAGVPAGQVERIDLSSGRVVLRLWLRRPDVVLRTGDSVQLRTLGPVGDRIVDIRPGPRSAPPLGPGDTLRGVEESAPR
ncbi:MAG TPA: MlaD family protein [Gemmatimonadaceae bacterium]|nr:MlaD family protein [Gemmatimonadaceae bacterium]